jgi:FKBP-type peptidyl-prolyl cis-trans isomerase FklB
MKLKALIVVLAGVYMISLISCGKKSIGSLKNETDSISYALGIDIGTSLKRAEMNDSSLNIDQFTKAMGQVLKNDTASLVLKGMNGRMVIQNYFMKAQTKKFNKNKKEGQDFLEKNKKNAGVVTLPSGVQYQIIKEGNGPKPLVTDTVTVHYIFNLINGSKIQSTEGKEPVKFKLNQVFPGWTEALQLMPVGSKWKVFIPSDLAYGQSGQQGMIEPNMTLIVEVELLAAKAGAPEKKGK